MRAEITKKKIVYHVPGMDDVPVRRAIEYSANEPGALTLGSLTMDLYYPPGSNLDSLAEASMPAVVIVLGYPDVGVTPVLGCQFREMEMVISWAQLFAASGMVGIVYETRNPGSDAQAALSFIADNSASLGIDKTRVGVGASSGNVPVALSVLLAGKARCGAFCYGFMLDLAGATGVSAAAAQFGFANPCAGRGMEDIPNETAIFIARAGKDQFPGVNQSIDAFVAESLRRNLPIVIMNHATGPHGFDLIDDSEASREVIRGVAAFLRARLGA